MRSSGIDGVVGKIRPQHFPYAVAELPGRELHGLEPIEEPVLVDIAATLPEPKKKAKGK